MDEKSIEIIFSDLGNVLVCFDRRRVARNLAIIIQNSEEVIHEVMNGPDGLALMKSFEIGDIDDVAFLAETSKRLACKLDPDQFWPAWNDMFWRNGPVTSLLERVQHESTGIKLIVVSDTDSHRLVHMMKLSGLAFDGAVASFHSEVRAWKKESIKPFRAALKMAKVSPERCLFIDDVLENTISASTLGIKTHHYETADKFEAELRRLRLIS